MTGDIITLYAMKVGVERTVAVKHFTDKLGISLEKSLSAQLVETFHQALLRNKHSLNVLMARKGLTLDTIKRWRLGLKDDRITIPITAAAGEIVNVRLYLPDAKNSADKMRNLEGRGKTRLFPVEAFGPEHDTVYVTEGEIKMFLLRQLGFNAVTTSGGANAWKDEFATEFTVKHVVFLYDIDDAGTRRVSR